MLNIIQRIINYIYLFAIVLMITRKYIKKLAFILYFYVALL